MMAAYWFYILQSGAVAALLTLVVVWIARRQDGQARLHLLRLFGTAAGWAWYVMLHNLHDPGYTETAWQWGNLLFGMAALWAMWRLVRWLVK